MLASDTVPGTVNSWTGLLPPKKGTAGKLNLKPVDITHVLNTKARADPKPTESKLAKDSPFISVSFGLTQDVLVNTFFFFFILNQEAKETCAELTAWSF